MSARLFPAFAIVLSLLLAGCSGTTLTSSWKDQEFRGPVQKVYIIGVGCPEVTRRHFEDNFNAELANHGVAGIASYRDLPPGETDNMDAIVVRLDQSGADSILMTSVIDKRSEEITVSNSNPDAYWVWNSYSYSNWNSYSYWNNYYFTRRPYDTHNYFVPATTTEFVLATIEANLYEKASGKLIWSAQLETLVENNLEKLIDDFAKTVVRGLRKDRLL